MDEAMRSLGDSFDRLVSAARRSIRVSAAAVAEDLQPAAWPVFREIVRSERIQATAIVAALGMDKSAVSRHVKELRELGLIDAIRDEVDARVLWISPTDAGRARIGTVFATQQQRLREQLETWPADDVERFAELLARFSAAT
jgi:DNA-binding MarR family transcriptional regulator